MFDGYRDEVVIGEGGLGRVYRAVRESTGGTVAIKSLRDVADSSPAWHRAHRELEAMLRVKGHPYVVTVEEIFLGPEGPCLVMEFLPGGSIADRMATGPLSDPELVVIGQHVTDALIAAHEVGIVHRDIKPANLMVGGFGQVKVGDFGISALARGDDQTKTASLTLAYASPEELDGDQRVEAPADVFSLAATLHHLFSGVRPTFGSRINGWPPLTGRDPAMGPVIAAIEAGLVDDIAARPTMQQFSEAFDRSATLLGERAVKRLDSSAATVVRSEPTAAAVGDVAPSRRPVLLAGAAVAALLLVVGAVAVLAGGDDNGDGGGGDGGDAGGPVSVTVDSITVDSIATDSIPTDTDTVAVDADPGAGGVTTDSADVPATGVAGTDGPETEITVPVVVADGVLQIAGLFPITGSMADVAAAPEAGARLAVEEINAAGGVLGEPIALAVGDTGTTGDGAVGAFADLDTPPDVVIGPTTNDVGADLVEITRASGVLAISPASTDDALVGDLFARLVASNSAQGRAIAALMSESGAQRVAIVGIDSPEPQSIMDAAANSGLDVVLEQTFATDDAADLAQDLLDDSPEAVLISAFEEDTAALIDAIAAANDGEIPFALFGTDANTGGGLADLVSDPALLDGMVGTFVAAPAGVDLLERLGDISDPTYAAEAYDAVVLAALAATAAGTDDAGSIETEIVTVSTGGTDCTTFADCAERLGAGEDIRYVGRSGDLDLTDDLERVQASVLVFRYDAAAEFVFERVLDQG